MEVKAVSVKIDIPPDFFENYVNDKDFWPFLLSVESDHAGYVEFGTQAWEKRSSSGSSSGANSKFYENIRKWLYDRGANISGKHVGKTSNEEQVIYAVMKKIIDNGIPPQPFIRPAVHLIEAMIENGEYKSKTMRDISDDLIFEMINKLEENHTLYGSEEIAKAIKCEIIPPSVAKNIEDLPMYGDKPIDEKIWASDYADLKGDEGRAKERQNRRLRF